MGVMVFHEVGKAVVGKPHVVQRHIQNFAVVGKRFFDMLFKQCRFSDSFRAFYSYYSSVPVDFVMEISLKIHAHLRNVAV